MAASGLVVNNTAAPSHLAYSGRSLECAHRVEIEYYYYLIHNSNVIIFPFAECTKETYYNVRTGV